MAIKWDTTELEPNTENTGIKWDNFDNSQATLSDSQKRIDTFRQQAQEAERQAQIAAQPSTLEKVGGVVKAIEQPFVSLAATPVQALAKGLGQPDPYAKGTLGGIEVSPIDKPLQKLGEAGLAASYLFPYGRFAKLGQMSALGKTTEIGVGAGTGYGIDVAAGLASGEKKEEVLKPGLGTALGSVIPGFAPIKKFLGRFTGETLGVTTGAGYGSVRQAYEASKQGGKALEAYTQALRGRVAPDAIVQEARDSLGTIITERGQAYRSQLEQIKGIPSSASPELQPLAQEARSLVESRTPQEITTKLEGIFGSHKELDAIEKALSNGDKVSGLDKLKLGAADDFMADLERATLDRDYVETEAILKQVRNRLKNAPAIPKELRSTPPSLQPTAQAKLESLDISPITNELNSQLEKFGIGIKNGVLDFSQSAIRFDKSAQAEVQTIFDEMKTFGLQEGDRTVVGVDSLKQALGDLYSKSSNVRAFVTAVKGTARKVLSGVEGYDKLAKDYAEKTEVIKEIQKGLSLGDQAQVDTAFKKLVSALRLNNDQRKEMIEELDRASGGQLSSKIAGQQMSELLPRGIMRPLAGGSALAAAIGGYWVPLLKFAALASPKFVGEMTRVIGLTDTQITKVLDAIGGPTTLQRGISPTIQTSTIPPGPEKQTEEQI